MSRDDAVAMPGYGAFILPREVQDPGTRAQLDSQESQRSHLHQDEGPTHQP